MVFCSVCPGGLQSRLLRSDGLQSCLLCPGGLQSHLLHPGGLQSSLLHPGGLQSRLLCLGTLLCQLCLGSWSWHFLMDLTHRPSPGSTFAPPPSWIFLSFFEGGGGSVTNQVHGLPLTHHQRSLAHHMDSCTTLTVELHLRLQFPSSFALMIHTADCTEHTPYINHGLPLPLGRVLYSVYPSDSYSTELSKLL